MAALLLRAANRGMPSTVYGGEGGAGSPQCRLTVVTSSTYVDRLGEVAVEASGLAVSLHRLGRRRRGCGGQVGEEGAERRGGGEAGEWIVHQHECRADVKWPSNPVQEGMGQLPVVRMPPPWLRRRGPPSLGTSRSTNPKGATSSHRRDGALLRRTGARADPAA